MIGSEVLSRSDSEILSLYSYTATDRRCYDLMYRSLANRSDLKFATVEIHGLLFSTFFSVQFFVSSACAIDYNLPFFLMLQFRNMNTYTFIRDSWSILFLSRTPFASFCVCWLLDLLVSSRVFPEKTACFSFAQSLAGNTRKIRANLKSNKNWDRQ